MFFSESMVEACFHLKNAGLRVTGEREAPKLWNKLPCKTTGWHSLYCAVWAGQYIQKEIWRGEVKQIYANSIKPSGAHISLQNESNSAPVCFLCPRLQRARHSSRGLESERHAMSFVIGKVDSESSQMWDLKVLWVSWCFMFPIDFGKSLTAPWCLHECSNVSWFDIRSLRGHYIPQLSSSQMKISPPAPEAGWRRLVWRCPPLGFASWDSGRSGNQIGLFWQDSACIATYCQYFLFYFTDIPNIVNSQ